MEGRTVYLGAERACYASCYRHKCRWGLAIDEETMALLSGTSMSIPLPKGIIVDCFETVLAKPAMNPLAGYERMLSLAAAPPDIEPSMVKALVDSVFEPVWQSRGFFEMPARLVFNPVFDLLGIEMNGDVDTEMEFWRYGATAEAEPEVAKGLMCVRDQARLPVALLSNLSFSHRVIEWQLEQFGLREFFSVVVASSDYALRKPHPAVFRAVATRLGLAPRDVWYIGDSLVDDVIGARGAGMIAVWYNRDGKGRAHSEAQVDLELHGWSEIASLLR